jgi:hypothetical protein
MRGIGVGGDLALVGPNLRWKRSKYGALGLVIDKGPSELDIWLGDLVALKNGRKLPWTEIVLSLLALTFMPLLLLRPTLWLGALNLILMAFNGCYRHTLEIRTQRGTFNFAVKSIDDWLAHILDAARTHNAGSPVMPGAKEST